MQEFFKSTLISKYIKRLISTTPLPLLTPVSDSDFLCKDTFYIYKNNIVKCTKSGHIRPQLSLIICGMQILKDNQLQDLTASTSLYVGQRIPAIEEEASLQIIEPYFADEYKAGINYYYRDTNSYYDPQTHIALGQLLRMYKESYDLNLMHMYNCFPNLLFNDISLQYEEDHGYKVVQNKNLKTRVLATPIKFGKTYTIAYSTKNPVKIYPILRDDFGLIKTFNGTIDLTNDALLPSYEHNHYKELTGETLCYDEPNKFSVQSLIYNPTNINKQYNLNHYEKYLYLCIEINDSEVVNPVIIEGDYTQKNRSLMLTRGSQKIGLYTYIEDDTISSDQVHLQDTLALNPSLLVFQPSVAQPFSDNLIQYLLDNPIISNNNYQKDIAQIQEILDLNDDGIWTENIQKSAMLAMNYSESFKNNVKNNPSLLLDQTGYIDRNMESVLHGYQN